MLSMNMPASEREAIRISLRSSRRFSMFSMISSAIATSESLLFALFWNLL